MNEKDERFIKINLELFEDGELNNTERIVLSYIKGFPNGYYSTLTNMADILGSTRKTVSNVISALSEKGYVYKIENTFFASKKETQTGKMVTQTGKNVTHEQVYENQTDYGEKCPIECNETTHSTGKNVTPTSNNVTQTGKIVTPLQVSENQTDYGEKCPIECNETTHQTGKNVTQSVTKLPTYNKEINNYYICDNNICPKNEHEKFFVEDGLIFEILDDDEDFDVTKDYTSDETETESENDIESERINDTSFEIEDMGSCQDDKNLYRPDNSEVIDYFSKNNLSYLIIDFIFYYDKHGWSKNGQAIDWKKKALEFAKNTRI